MACHLHHTHLFASDINKSIQFYTEFFGGRVVMDLKMAGSRNVFLSIGRGRLHFYDQAPKNPVRGNIHHIGIQTDNLEEMVKKLTAGGVPLNKGDNGFWILEIHHGPGAGQRAYRTFSGRQNPVVERTKRLF